jgi:hypothetical protein
MKYSLYVNIVMMIELLFAEYFERVNLTCAVVFFFIVHFMLIHTAYKWSIEDD